jgi:hypothetical protein
MRYLRVLDDSLRVAVQTPFDLVVGPDYALSNKMDMNKPAHVALVRQKLKYIGGTFPGTTIVAGTMPFQISVNQMAHAAFVYQGGRELQFRKQTDHGESDIASRHGLEYFRERGVPAIFNVRGKKAWLNICGDRGRKPEGVCNDADLEITIAHDVNAGFHIGSNTPRNNRFMILSDSYHPIVAVQKFDSESGPQEVSPVSSTEHMEVFELK